MKMYSKMTEIRLSLHFTSSFHCPLPYPSILAKGSRESMRESDRTISYIVQAVLHKARRVRGEPAHPGKGIPFPNSNKDSLWVSCNSGSKFQLHYWHILGHLTKSL